jgi:hypothetical protein
MVDDPSPLGFRWVWKLVVPEVEDPASCCWVPVEVPDE